MWLWNNKIAYAFIHRSLCGRHAFKNSVAVQRTAPSMPLHSANPRITPRQILSSNKGLLFAGGLHTWPEPALLRNARNGTVCVSQRKLAAANYAPLTALSTATSNMKARNYIKLREKGRCCGTGVEGGKTRGRSATFVRERNPGWGANTHSAREPHVFRGVLDRAKAKRGSESSSISKHAVLAAVRSNRESIARSVDPGRYGKLTLSRYLCAQIRKTDVISHYSKTPRERQDEKITPLLGFPKISSTQDKKRYKTRIVHDKIIETVGIEKKVCFFAHFQLNMN